MCAAVRRLVRYVHHTMVLVVVAMTMVMTTSAQAQESQRIAAVVNDKIISVRDLENRTRIIVLVSKLPNTAQTHRRLWPQVLRQLIDEQLQKQEAERLNIVVSDRDLARAKGLMEKRIRMPGGSLDQFIKVNRIDEESALNQIRTSVAWTKLVQRRFANVAEISDEEIDEVSDKFKNSLGKPQFLVAEILLPIGDSNSETEVEQLADRLHGEIAKGGNFSRIAQEFSAAASAAKGGRIGWISPGQLSTELDARLQTMKPGQVTKPMRTVFGYNILKLVDRRILSAADPMQAKVTLKHVFLPLAAKASNSEVAAQLGIAEAIASSVQNCPDMDALAKEVKSPAGADLGKFQVGELSPTMREAVAKLESGVASKPVRLPTGFSVMMVCDREEAPSNIPTRDEIGKRLKAQKLDTLARRYLRDLRRDAFIEPRI